MNLRIYLIVEEGAERVFVQTTYPIWYNKPTDRYAEVLAVDVPILGVERSPDGVITLPARLAARTAQAPEPVPGTRGLGV